ncbi:MAG: hypothetical protein WD278_04085 [Pirellulales bacterium]
MTHADSTETRQGLAGYALAGLLVGLVGAGLCAFGAWSEPESFYPAWLVAYLFWLGIALGCLAISMLHHLTGGAWGRVIRRVVESGAATLPLLALLFLPVWLGMEHLYVWAQSGVVEADPLLAGKSRYLNVESFGTRAVAYFAIWSALALWSNRWSATTDASAEARRQRPLQLLSGPGLILYGLTVTFASIDWAMSLEPHWYSSMYGVLFIGGQAVSGMSAATLTVIALGRRRPWSESATPERLNDLGNLLLAFVMFWSYVGFMQYLIIWSGNLPEETPWYANRTAGGWQLLAWCLIVFHFAVPFLLLLSRRTKRAPARLATVLVVLLVMRLVDLFWLVMPAFHPEGIRVHWLHVAAPVAIGGLWLAVFAWRLSARAELPVYGVQIEERAHG